MTNTKQEIEEKITNLEMDIFINGKDTEKNREKLDKLKKEVCFIVTEKKLQRDLFKSIDKLHEKE